MGVHNVSCFNSTSWDCEENMNSSVSLDPIEKDDSKNVMTILSTAIASVGIVANMNVVVVFMCQPKLRRKIPNMFIINQVNVRRLLKLLSYGCKMHHVLPYAWNG